MLGVWIKTEDLSLNFPEAVPLEMSSLTHPKVIPNPFFLCFHTCKSTMKVAHIYLQSLSYEDIQEHL